ncbi:hypothetical protein E6W36_14575 [Hankyongella ginsenosidimutans]|uniref:Tetratricopeptide repeat protein n=1 Tax=Hankyongella ginsenosidimutans TaxID=1763828 RepID=A0A4D7C5A9_9SPHN|nr:hypothetical protein [Hankyongella ginsenosidimutans]QCI80291.1 hypothetical protein E6W36_14575 [Hankyongella ginsenosidimutans]
MTFPVRSTTWIDRCWTKNRISGSGARALEAAGRSADALKAYTAGADVLAAFPPRDQAEFQLAAIRADLRQGTDAQARKIIDDLPAKG